MAHQFICCDIPGVDLDRTIGFYSEVIGAEMKKHDVPAMSIGLLPDANTSVSACFFVSEKDKPSDTGPLIYLNCSGRFDAQVEPNSGKILQPKQQIGDYESRAVILDSGGNRMALGSNWSDVPAADSRYSSRVSISESKESAPVYAGLCENCLHSRKTVSDRGSAFWRCALAAIDPRFPKYPRLPVVSCAGYQTKTEDR